VTQDLEISQKCANLSFPYCCAHTS